MRVSLSRFFHQRAMNVCLAPATTASAYRRSVCQVDCAAASVGYTIALRCLLFVVARVIVCAQRRAMPRHMARQRRHAVAVTTRRQRPDCHHGRDEMPPGLIRCCHAADACILAC